MARAARDSSSRPAASRRRPNGLLPVYVYAGVNDDRVVNAPSSRTGLLRISLRCSPEWGRPWRRWCPTGTICRRQIGIAPRERPTLSADRRQLPVVSTRSIRTTGSIGRIASAGRAESAGHPTVMQVAVPLAGGVSAAPSAFRSPPPPPAPCRCSRFRFAAARRRTSFPSRPRRPLRGARRGCV